MSDEPERASTPSQVDKGKARATVVDERTPLLDSPASSSNAVAHNGELDQPTYPARSRLGTQLAMVFAASLLFAIVVVLLFILTAYSYVAKASNLDTNVLLEQALVFRGPQHVTVVNMTQDGSLWIQANALVGIDAGAIIDVHSDEEDGVLAQVQKSLGRWGIERLATLSVKPSEAHVYARFERDDHFLARVECEPLELALTADPPPNASWLTPITVQLHMTPTTDASALVQYAREAWSSNAISLRVEVPRVVVRGGRLGDRGWRKSLRKARENVKANIAFKLPHFPGIPNPDTHQPFPPISELVTLVNYNVTSSPDNNNRLYINAQATVINPAPDSFSLSPPSLPFTVHLPQENDKLLPVATVHTLPFKLTHPNITLGITGRILPFPSDRIASATLSAFLTNYLSSKASPIIITTPLLPNVTVDTLFPAPNPRPQILRDVTIRNMKIRPIGSKLYASGTVFAHVVLPKGLNVDLVVNGVLPDVLVFDGQVPDSESDLPDPLPEGAFGHIRPSDWLDAMSVPIDPDEENGNVGSIYAVSAKVVDVPLEVLPGREKEFSNFVGKVIFGSSGAVAGILGHADVRADVHGLNGNMELGGLPFRGAVRVGKGSM